MSRIDLEIQLANFFFTKIHSCVVLMPEEPEDMWHAYNVISEGDYVRSTTIRKVQSETATGSSSSSRIRTTLTISVESIDFDTQACVLRLKGRNVEENQYVKVIAIFSFLECLMSQFIKTNIFNTNRWALIIRWT